MRSVCAAKRGASAVSRRLEQHERLARTRLGRRAEGGFTMVELIIAMMIMAIVMAALAPAFYGELKAAAATDYRSTANGLAVAAIEQMRAFPYYQVGWNQSDYSQAGSTALSCVSTTNANQTGGTAPTWNTSAGQNPVELTTAQTGASGSALDSSTNNLLTTQKIGPINYTITRCVYWVQSSVGSSTTGAYKQTWVGVSWLVGSTAWHISQISAIYPGGEGTYSANNDDAPGAPACSNHGTVPASPTGLTASQDASDKTGTIDLTWSEGSNPSSVFPITYEVDYSTTGTSGPWTKFSQNSLAYQNVDGLAPGTTYYFQVWAWACDNTQSVSATSGSQATANASQACTATNFQVTPASTTVGSSDHLDAVSALTISVQVTNSCSNVAAYYSPKNDGTYVTDTGPASTGSLSWSTSASKWAAGTITFHLYIGGSDTGDTALVQISCDAKKCSG